MSAWGWLFGAGALFLWAESRKRPAGAMAAEGGTSHPLALATIGAQARTARAQAAARGSSTASLDALRLALPLAGATLGLASTLYKQIARVIATGSESRASRLVDNLETSPTSQTTSVAGSTPDLTGSADASSQSGALDHLAELGGAQTVPASNDDLTMITDLDAGSATTDALDHLADLGGTQTASASTTTPGITFVPASAVPPDDFSAESAYLAPATVVHLQDAIAVTPPATALDHLAELSAPAPPPDTLGISGMQVLSPSVAAVDVGDALTALTIPTTDAETAFQGAMQSAGPATDASSFPVGAALGIAGAAAGAAGTALGSGDPTQTGLAAAQGAVGVGSQVASSLGFATDISGVPVAPVVQFALGLGDTLQSPSIITTPVQVLATAATNLAAAGADAAVAGAGGAAEAAGLAASAPAVSGAAAAGVLGLATVPLIVGALIEMFDQPSKAWLEFPSKVFTTDNETRKANYQLLTDLVNAQTQGDIVNAIAAWKAWIGQRVGGFGAGSGPHDLPIPPGSGWEIHGEPVPLDQYYDPSAEMAGLEAAKQAALAGQSPHIRLVAYKTAYAPIAAAISAPFDPARVAKWVAAGAPDPYKYDDAFLAAYLTEIYTTPSITTTEGGDTILPPPTPPPAAIAAVPSLATLQESPTDALTRLQRLYPWLVAEVDYYRGLGMSDAEILPLTSAYELTTSPLAGGG